MEQILWNCEEVLDHGTKHQMCYLNANDPLFTPFFSSGDIMISILLLVLIILQLVKILNKSISSVSVVRKYQGNNSPDGKEFYKI